MWSLATKMLEAPKHGFKPFFRYVLFVLFWVSYLSSLSLNFLILKQARSTLQNQNENIKR